MADHQLLRNTRPEHRFFLPDGSSISNMRELSQSLRSMPEGVFKHHVNTTKNDFHSWVSSVIKDTHLSKEIQQVRDQKKMAVLVAKRVAELDSRDARNEISRAVSMQQSKQELDIAKGLEIIVGVPAAKEPIKQPAVKKSPGFKPLVGIPKKAGPRIEPMAIRPVHKKPVPTETVKEEPVKKEKPQHAKAMIKAKIREKIKTPSYNEIPSAPRPFYFKTPVEHNVLSQHDHKLHIGCVRCGMIEFGIGLTVGIITTLMFARAFL